MYTNILIVRSLLQYNGTETHVICIQPMLYVFNLKMEMTSL